MPSITSWITDTPSWLNGYIPSLEPVSITVVRGATALSPQTVRIESWVNRQRPGEGESGTTGLMDGILVGYKGHPTIADTDLQLGDRFVAEGINFEVMIMFPGIKGEVQALLRIRE